MVFLFLGLKETMLELIFQKKKKMKLMSYILNEVQIKFCFVIKFSHLGVSKN